MIKSLKELWNKPYPALDNKKDNLLMSFAIGLFVFLFLWIFKPFENTAGWHDSVLLIAGFGAVTTLIMLLNSILFEGLVKSQWNPDQWKLKHTFWVSLWNIIIIAIANYYYFMVITQSESSLPELFKMVYQTLTIGVFPLIIILIYSERLLLKKNIQKAGEISDSLHKEKYQNPPHSHQQADTLSVIADIPSDNFNVEPRKIIYIKAEGNYASFATAGNHSMNEQIKRVTLKSLEEQLKPFPYLVRTHRSFIVNLGKVEKISGNARNFTLHLNGSDIKIPVSRSREKAILTALKKL